MSVICSLKGVGSQLKLSVVALYLYRPFSVPTHMKSNGSTYSGVISEYLESITVETVKPVFCAKPQKSFLILYAANHCVVRKTILYLVMTEIIGLPGHIKG